MAGTLLDILKTLILAILGSMPDEELLDILAQRIFPEVVWETEWTKDQAILDELDTETVQEIQVTSLVIDVMCMD